MAKKPRRKSRKAPQVDIKAIIEKPVTVSQGGQQRAMSSFEVQLRAQVKKALKDKSLPAIENLLRLARQYNLVVPPPSVPEGGGVLIVPGRYSKEAWEALFKQDKPEAESGE